MDKTNGEITIGGAGASMLDVIRGAEAWEGLMKSRGTPAKAQITIVTPRPSVKVWGLDLRKNNVPALEAQGKVLAGQFVHNVEALGKGKDVLEYVELLSEIVHGDDGVSVGPQNIFAALADENTRRAIVAAVDNDKIADDLLEYVDSYSRAQTSPSSYEAVRRFEQAGQLSYVAGYISGKDMTIENGQIAMPVSASSESDFEGVKTMQVAGFADCFSLANAPYYPLRDKSKEPDYIQADTITLKIDGQDVDVYVPDSLTRGLLRDGYAKIPSLNSGVVEPAKDFEGFIAFTGSGASKKRGVPYSQAIIKAQREISEFCCELWNSRFGHADLGTEADLEQVARLNR